MQELGYRWVRQTVSEVEVGRRRVTVEEVLGSAIALETSMTALLVPVDGDKTVDLPCGQEISVTAVQMLARGLTDVGVTWYGDNKVVFNVQAATVERFRQMFGEGGPQCPASDAAVTTQGMR